jgi:hypothetical protein
MTNGPQETSQDVPEEARTGFALRLLDVSAGLDCLWISSNESAILLLFSKRRYV